MILFAVSYYTYLLCCINDTVSYKVSAKTEKKRGGRSSFSAPMMRGLGAWVLWVAGVAWRAGVHGEPVHYGMVFACSEVRAS